ncbi:MAG: pilus assembly protein PilM [Candidatus Omnitrophica bacterium]|nr:pilus assembly protein PilM [Candidatus Omnitrophota bacterium]
MPPVRLSIERLKAVWDSKIPSGWRRPWIGVGLDVDAAAARAVVLRHQPQTFTLLSAAAKAIPEPSDRSAAASVIRDLLETVHFSALRAPRVSSAVHGSSAVVRFATFPAMTPAELKQAVPYEADKYIPFQMSEVVLDSQPVGAPVGGKQEVLLVAAKKELIQDQIQLLRDAGVAPHVIDLEAFALANAWEAVFKPQEGQVTALLSAGTQRCLLDVFSGTQLRLTREFPLAVTADAPASGVEAVVKQLRLSYDYFENQSGKDVDHLLLTGALSADPNFASQLQATLNHPVQIWNPLASIEKDPACAAQNLEQISGDLSVAFGLALRKCSA